MPPDLMFICFARGILIGFQKSDFKVKTFCFLFCDVEAKLPPILLEVRLMSC